MKFLKIAPQWIDVGLAITCSLIVVVFAGLLAVQVALRYLFDAPLFWVEELCRFLLVHLTFFGAAMAWGRRDHISIDFALDIVSAKVRSLLTLLIDLIVLGFSIWGVGAGLTYALASMSRASIALSMPSGLAYFCVPLSFSLIVIQTLIFLSQRVLRTKPAPLKFGGV